MKSIRAAVWICCMLPAAALSAQVNSLDRERNPSKLAVAAVAIVQSGDNQKIASLAAHLGQQSFLGRLDPPGATTGLESIFRAIEEHPSEAGERLCVDLAANPDFGALPARMNFLLNALAAVRPMSAAGAEVFRKTARSGFLEVDGPLLAANGSPRAVEVLEEILADKTLDPDQRVSTSHWSIVPHRTDGPIVAMCARLLDRGRLSPEVAAAVAESLFDYRPKEWFGVRINQPSPPAWSLAGVAAKDAARQLGDRLLARPGLPDLLRAVIERTLAELR